MKKYVIIAHLPLTFCFKHLPRKITSWLTFFIVINIRPDFGRLFSLLSEVAQMTKNKNKAQNFGVRGDMKFI